MVEHLYGKNYHIKVRGQHYNHRRQQMKTQLYLLLLICFIGLNLKTLAQVPNGGFESWVLDADSNLNPEFWETSNVFPIVSVNQYTPAYAGNYSLRAFAFDGGGFTIPGVAYINFPMNTRPTHLRVCLKTTVMPGDQTMVMFAAWNGDSAIAAADSCTFKFDTTVTTFTCFNLPLNYISQLTPDSATILISGGNFSTAQVGTEIIVDELSFLGVGIDETLEASDGIQIFPNPASDMITISSTLQKSTPVTLFICDVNGREVMTTELQKGIVSQQLRVADLANGIYCCRLGNSSGLVKKFVIAR